MSTTNPEWRTTEWDDILIKKGIIEAPEKQLTEVELNKAAIDIAEQINVLENKSLDELNIIAEDEGDENDDLESIRRKRMQQLKAMSKSARFGSIFHVTKTNFVSEITEASKTANVICHLYTESKPECILLNEYLEALARIHKDVKICKAIATDVMENFPEDRCPCILIYKDGQCVNQIVGAHNFHDYKRKYSASVVEWVLKEQNVFNETTLSEEDPREPEGASKKDVFGYSAAKLFGAIEKKDHSDDESDSDEKNDREYSSFGRLGNKSSLSRR